MRPLIFACLALASSVACNAPLDVPGPLDGAWKLDSASPGLPPRTMTLMQRGTSVTGTGAAAGVDAPIPVTISGATAGATAVSPVLVQLLFSFDYGSQTAAFSGTLTGDGRIVGSVVYYGITSVPQPGRLAFARP